jgi:hypothetical protein
VYLHQARQSTWARPSKTRKNPTKKAQKPANTSIKTKTSTQILSICYKDYLKLKFK